MSSNENTETDAWSFKKKKPDDLEITLNKPVGAVGVDPYNDYYKMNHVKRGVALIFNHSEFDSYELTPRKGTELDRDHMEDVLKGLAFDVRTYNNLKYGGIYDVLTGVAEEDHTNSDCLVVVVMSHGDQGIIHARDHSYPPDTLWTHFTGDVCPKLAGKPKLFFLQCCRGENIDSGVTLKSRIQKDPPQINSYVIPAMADFLVMYGTTEDHYSFRSPTNGSWFIQALCKELEKRSQHQDLLTILTFVNRTIAIDFQSNTPGNSRFHKKKQVGSITSSLMRLLYFYPHNEK